MVKQNQIIAALFFFFLLGAGSVFGGAKNTGSNRPEALLPTGALEDSLVGVWEVTNVDVSAIRAQIAAAPLQVDKDGLAAKITKIQKNLMGMKMTVRQDHTYETSLNQNYLSGTWTVSNRDFTPHSLSHETIDRTLSITSLAPTTFVAKCNYGDSMVVVTYTRRQ